MLASFQEANRKRNAEWDPEGKLTLEFFGCELAGEVGETCNIIKKLTRERLGLRGSRSSILELRDELHDVIICVCLVANAAGIDLDPAEKFNATSRKLGLSVFI